MASFAQTNREIFKKTNKKGSVENKNEAVVQLENVMVNKDILMNVTTKEFSMTFLNEKISLIKSEEGYFESKNYRVFAKIKNDEGGFAVFSIVNNVVVGNIRTSKKVYQLVYIGNNINQIREIDLKTLKENDEDVKEKAQPIKRNLEDGACTNTDGPDLIDIMTVYTPASKTAAGGKDAIEAEIYLALYNTNLAYSNSGVNQRLRLVYVGEINYTEANNGTLDVGRLRGTTDGFMDGIHALRDTYSADLVTLIVETLEPGLFGIAYNIMSTPSTAFESDAFCVVRRANASVNYTYAHELGHLMGLRHECGGDPTLSPYNYAHGYCSPFGWRTIMGRNACGGTRLPYFSNPAVAYGGNPMGTTGTGCQADNHQVLNNTAIFTANFRCHSANRNDVWMKDSWDDNGSEPNNITNPLWLSPYIWVRNEDDGLLHQHEHQNPEHGSANYPYVKLHNGGTTATGTLKLYIANASVSLTWPTSWTEIGSKNVTINAHSSEVVKFDPWNATEGTGHFCMIARWISSTDPMPIEGTDVWLNVKNTNNIIWRNMNIVDLLADKANVEMNYSPIRGTTLVIESDKKTGVFPGKVLVEFDEKTTKYLSTVGLKADGVEKQNGGRYLIDLSKKSGIFYNVNFDDSFVGKIKLKFLSDLKETKGKTYLIHVSQQSRVKNKIQNIGGVSYQINTSLTKK